MCVQTEKHPRSARGTLETRLGGVCEWGREQHRGAPEAEGGWVSPVARGRGQSSRKLGPCGGLCLSLSWWVGWLTVLSALQGVKLWISSWASEIIMAPGHRYWIGWQEQKALTLNRMSTWSQVLISPSSWALDPAHHEPLSGPFGPKWPVWAHPPWRPHAPDLLDGAWAARAHS